MQASAHRSEWSATPTEVAGHGYKPAGADAANADAFGTDLLCRPALAPEKSHGTLSFSDVELIVADMARLSMKVRNDSPTYHREFIQIYAKPVAPGALDRLVGWEAIALKPGQIVDLTIDIDDGLLSRFDDPVSQILTGPWIILIKSLSTVRHSQEIYIPVG